MITSSLELEIGLLFKAILQRHVSVLRIYVLYIGGSGFESQSGDLHSTVNFSLFISLQPSNKLCKIFI
jgi:hypothetical protein